MNSYKHFEKERKREGEKEVTFNVTKMVHICFLILSLVIKLLILK